MIIIGVLTAVHIVICFFLVIVVLLQSGKAADLAGAFGGMGSQTAFGPRGSATILSKATTIAAGLFMVTSMTLAILASRSAATGRTVLGQQPARPPVTAPAKPAPPVPTGAGGMAQPSVTVTPPGGGPSQTIPLTLPPPPAKGQPAAPAKPAPAKPAGQPATPPAK